MKLCKKAAPRFELGIRALQAPALPLGHAARDFVSAVSHHRMSIDQKSSAIHSKFMIPAPFAEHLKVDAEWQDVICIQEL
jgi:hypothetical protein